MRETHRRNRPGIRISDQNGGLSETVLTLLIGGRLC